LTKCAFYPYFAIECFRDLFADVQPKSNALFVVSSGIFEFSEHLKKTLLVEIADANTCILHRDFEHVFCFVEAKENSNVAFVRELHGVGYKIQDHLLQPPCVAVQGVRNLILTLGKFNQKLDTFLSGLDLEELLYLEEVDPDEEGLFVLLKLSCLEQEDVKHVVDQVK
jgi:hypothetical protein